MSHDDISAGSLDELLSAAIDGGREAVERFYTRLLDARVVVPRRFQALPLSDSPEYPHELFDLLGVKDRERVCIPIFTTAESVPAWSGTEFLLREISLTELLGLVPDGWWIVLNPGSEVEKEFSPWELEQLRAGQESVPLLVEEALADEAEHGLSFCEIEPEFVGLGGVLADFAQSRSEIESVYLLQRQREATDAGLPALVVGVRTYGISVDAQEQLRSDMVAVAEKALIGAATVQVVLGGALGGSMLDEVFGRFSPCFSRKEPKSGVISKVFNWFGRPR
jgi:hypothetical protein